MKAVRNFIVVCLVCVLFSCVVAGLGTELETERCSLYSVECGGLGIIFGCTLTGDDFCSGNSDEKYCAMTEGGPCEMVQTIRANCENCVLCCDYEVDFWHEVKDSCKGPSVTDMFTPGTVTFEPIDEYWQTNSFTDSCIEGTPDLVRKHLCDPEGPGAPGCAPQKPALLIASNRDCPGSHPYCSSGRCVECRNVDDCGEGKICDDTNKCVGVEVPEEPEPEPEPEPTVLPCPPVSCTTNDDCYDCCNGIILNHHGACEDDGTCKYVPYPCIEGAGCSNEKGCCGTLNGWCCDDDVVCYGGLVCDTQVDKCKDTCSEAGIDTFRCDSNDAEGKKRQKCHQEGDSFVWVDYDSCQLGCDNSTGQCKLPGAGECNPSQINNMCLPGQSDEPTNHAFGATACCSATRYWECKKVGDEYKPMKPEGNPCPNNEVCSWPLLQWSGQYNGENGCVGPCEGLTCENPYSVCTGGKQTYNHCVNNACVADPPIDCEEGCDSNNALCKEALPCGSAISADCCNEEGNECWGEDLVCNFDSGKCEHCGGNGELACDDDGPGGNLPYCDTGFVLGDDGRCWDCEIFEVRWDSEKEEDINTSVEGQKVFAVVEGNNACYATGFSLDNLIIYEKSSLLGWFNDEIDFALGSELFFNSDNQVKFEWTSEIGQGNLEPDYFFEISYDKTQKWKSDDLRVLFCNKWYKKGDDLNKITTCADYNKVDGNEKTQCLADCAGAAVRESAELGYIGMQMPGCSWVNDKCALTYQDVGGDGVGGVGGEDYNCMIDYDQLDECESGDTHRTVVYRAKELNEFGDIIEGSANCDAGCGTEICTKQVLCPGIVKMPFFGLISFMMSLVIIGMIYFIRRK